MDIGKTVGRDKLIGGGIDPTGAQFGQFQTMCIMLVEGIETRKVFGIGDYQARIATAEYMLKLRLRRLRIQRDIEFASFQYTQDGNDGTGALIQHECDRLATISPHCQNVIGNPVAAEIEFPVGEVAPITRPDSKTFTMTPNLPLEARRYGLFNFRLIEPEKIETAILHTNRHCVTISSLGKLS
jgi:hypothetical protein